MCRYKNRLCKKMYVLYNYVESTIHPAYPSVHTLRFPVPGLCICDRDPEAVEAQSV